MNFVINKKIIGIVFGIIIFMQSAVFAQEAELDNIIVTNTRDDLLLYFNVKGAFTKEMEEAILSGVPASFTYFITLHRVRDMWLDEKLSDIEIVYTIKYNKMKNEFAFYQSHGNEKPEIFKSLNEAKKHMSEIESLQVIQIDRLKKGSHYQISSKAELSKLPLPLYMHYLLFFVSIWDFETDWYTIDFTY